MVQHGTIVDIFKPEYQLLIAKYGVNLPTFLLYFVLFIQISRQRGTNERIKTIDIKVADQAKKIQNIDLVSLENNYNIKLLQKQGSEYQTPLKQTLNSSMQVPGGRIESFENQHIVG